MSARLVTLFDADDPEPALVLCPDGRSQFLLAADHAGRAIPRRLGSLGLSADELERHIAWDIGIGAVTARLSEALDAVAVLQRYSRLVIDCNRGHQAESSIPIVSETTAIPGNRNLLPAARAARQRDIFAPYHARIRAILDARQRDRRRTVLIAMHSFTPLFKGERRPMQAGVLYNRDPRLARIMLELLRAEGDLIVGDNAPYAVSDATDYTVPEHGERRGIPHVEIEIRQDLIADVGGQEAWAARLARLLPAADARFRELGG